ncbi:MAG: cytochrome c-type biogenesis protein CcmH [Gammaproteobacteria bacterium]|nr:cytochrome c-type biogenesis protein CcmH [Gammaproteobacteria bacterium]
MGVAAEPEKFPDERMQARYDQLITELRCLVCQSGSIAESNALLAADLRREVRDMLLAGRSDDEIRRFMTERYGDFVLYRPPLAPRTWLLWFSPVLLLGIGALVAYRVVSQRARLADADSDEPAEGERT